ncbi:MAG: carbohydrate ABC transporter permease [Clostridia bacterium]|jgi:putative aldouronate transport system permease protein|nr:carbohydrate ABC transporter permease [Clostridia bacterium]
MKRFDFNKWIAPDNKTYPIVKKAMILYIAVAFIGFAFFAYVSHVHIDEGTAAMYSALKTLFVVFCVLAVPAVAMIAFIIATDVKRKRAYYSQFNRSKLNKHVHVFDVINTILMALFCILCVYPIIYVLAGSFNQGADYTIGGVYFLPRLFTFENFKVVLENTAMWRSYLITIGRTVIGVVTALLFTATVAYAMSRPNLKCKKAFYWVNIFTMFFSGGLVPSFLIINALGLFDSFLVYIIPGLYSVYNMIVIQSGFKSISNEIHDSAMIDGAGEFRIFWQIYMPLNKPVLATVVLWLAVGHWNSYFDTMIYTKSDNLQSLQYFLLKAIQTSTMTEGMPPELMERISPKTISYAAIIISIIPVLMFFPLIRKNFASGIMIGSLKG